MSCPIAIASDHAGFRLKSGLIKTFSSWDWKDLGPSNTDRVDYPDYALKVAEWVAQEPDTRRGILVCGSGIGMSMAANKVAGIRAAVVDNPVMARLSKEHNNSNILCLGERFSALPYASEMVQAWMDAEFDPALESNQRHLSRIHKIHQIDGWTK